MCGITGFWSDQFFDPAIVENMATRITRRGPDDAGVWADSEIGLALAHRRLSIQDLSPAGHQPMCSPCKRYTLVYNGEIYNHQKLRVELEREGGAFDWKGSSDTETLLAALIHWGLQGALERLNGMFAFALWDGRNRSLVLARDRMGEKPLYYGHSGGVFLFGSELKALKAHPAWQAKVNRDALALYMRHSYVPAPWSIYSGVFKLPPAHYVVIREQGLVIDEPHCYWDLSCIAESGTQQAVGGTSELIEDLDNLLRDSIGQRMSADVPLGAFLSGGYDSTMVVAQMQAQSDKPIKTFSIGFREEGYDEAQHAKAVASHLGTDHTELYVTPEQAIDVIHNLPTIYDEPFSDSSQIPTYLVSQLARNHVTVCLSGDGGDELFYGYGRYFKAEQLWSKLHRLPLPFRKLIGYSLNYVPGRFLDKAMRVLPLKYRISHLPDRLPKLAEMIAYPSGEALYRHFVSHFKDPATLVLGANEPNTILSQQETHPDVPSLREKMMYLDQMTYLPDDILTKVDRASMAVSLEARVPLLDHRLVEFAWQVPTEHKFRDGQSKWLLRQVLYKYVPKELMDRPKMGFGVPIEHWLRGPLREWAERLLEEQRLIEEGFFDPVQIRKMWREHLSGERRWHYYLWDVLMFQAWLEENE
ncbi:asparagine synthase (glutamine-hydrolyzing) [Salinivibrio kushneri]|uniref:asparagine synthase (glutamine-hydrolyzing) n=1 Tax=Salinivibrio kushneri TaxID=1908198 RepID=UPI0022B2F23A|nr:asparagine synthase (glutamine-hydrolyzing) [Salinivibrio kushneri]WBA17145.1 asparagine synthase (glutamine-hydrolyzing) [Salinivibrio kushneri]